MKAKKYHRKLAHQAAGASIQRTVLDGDELLSTANLAAMIDKPVSWVWNQPVELLPAQTRISRRTIFYRKSDVRNWLESRRVDLSAKRKF